MRKILTLALILSWLNTTQIWAQYNHNPGQDTSYSEIPTISEEAYPADEFATPHEEENYGISAEEGLESHPISIPQEAWNKLTDDKAFDYTEKEKIRANNEDNALLKFFGKIFEFLSSPAGKIVLWILILLLVGLIVYFILKRLNLTNRADKSIALGTEVTASFASETDWNTAINNALQQQNYPLAVAYMFRHLVFQLHEKEILKVTDTATNSRLLRDLRPQSYYKDFRAITTQYEYVCFGEYPINHKELEHYQQQYRKILQQI